MSEELLKTWQKHLTALKLKSSFGDMLAEKYWNEFIRRGGKPESLSTPPSNLSQDIDGNLTE